MSLRRFTSFRFALSRKSNFYPADLSNGVACEEPPQLCRYNMYKCTGHGPEVASWEHRENNIYGSGYFATCDTCDKVFRSVQAADQHMDAVGHWAEDENMNAWGYPKCSVCNRQFTTLDGLCQHKNALGHWDATQLNKDRDFRCGVCSRVCATEIGLRQHKVALSHWDDKQGPNQSKTRNTLEESNDVEEVGTYKNLTCEVCGRECSTSAGLRQHKNAVNHWAEAKSCKVAHPHPSPSCPHCRESFAAASGVAEHIESGSCQVATGFDPEGLKKVIRQRDPHQVRRRSTDSDHI